VVEDVRVRVHGDTAVLTGRVTAKGRLGSGRDISGQYRYLRVFVRRDGQWRLAAYSAVLIQ
jgi:ketosteroid isomerase-like protein